MSAPPRPAPAAAPLLLGALAGSLVAARIESALLCLGVAAVVALAIRAPRPGVKWVRSVVIGAAVAWGVNLFLVPGQAIGRLGPLIATDQGLTLGSLLALRVAGAAIAFLGLRAAWPGERAADEAARLLRPLERLGVRIGEARLMLGLALRFAPLLAHESARIARLQDMRAGRPPRSLGERLQRRRAVVLPSLVHALERAEQVALALEARHYRLRPPPRGPGPGWAPVVAGLMLPGIALFWRRT